ncbi:MAG: TonB-dependent receptor domain-containing protein, partial [Acidobacteriota bacterium]
RYTYNEAFQVANYSEFFLQADVAPPADLSPLNAFCAPFGVDCGFGPTRILALGNEDLEVEEIQTFEIGYSGIIQGRAFLTFEYYNSQADNFITDLLPQLGTSLGRVNPNFGAWQAPSGLPEPVAAAIRAVAPPILSNNIDGSNILAAVSYTNFGQVDTQGIDIGLSYYFVDDWTLSFTYSWFDFEIQEDLPGFESLLLPNSPENKFSVGLAYARDPFDASFGLRWVDDFRWAVGPFQGDVESYATVDATANYDLTENWTVGVNVANLFDDKHWEAFGGDLLERRALGHLLFKW